MPTWSMWVNMAQVSPASAIGHQLGATVSGDRLPFEPGACRPALSVVGLPAVASLAVSLTRAESAQVVGELRRARRRQRVASIHWVDALYQVYITGLIAVVAVVFVSSLLGDDKVSPSTVADIRAD